MADANAEAKPKFSLLDFLLKVASNEVVTIPDLWMAKDGHRTIKLPPLLPLFCSYCKGERYFSPTEDIYFYQQNFLREEIAIYHCKNCGKTIKKYSLWFRRDAEGSGGLAMKYGEEPPFGPIVPPDIERLLGADAPLFRKGVDAEARGLGIGAFAYYRRVVENQRDRLFEQTILAAQKLGADSDVIAQLKAAQAERQFTRSVDAIKPGPLKAIYIDGHNPLTLLHDAISEGLHAQTDAENLSSAQTIRVLLAELANRIDQALADHKEVADAVANLLKAKAARQNQKKSDPSPDQP